MVVIVSTLAERSDLIAGDYMGNEIEPVRYDLPYAAHPRVFQLQEQWTIGIMRNRRGTEQQMRLLGRLPYHNIDTILMRVVGVRWNAQNGSAIVRRCPGVQILDNYRILLISQQSVQRLVGKNNVSAAQQRIGQLVAILRAESGCQKIQYCGEGVLFALVPLWRSYLGLHKIDRVLYWNIANHRGKDDSASR